MSDDEKEKPETTDSPEEAKAEAEAPVEESEAPAEDAKASLRERVQRSLGAPES